MKFSLTFLVLFFSSYVLLAQNWTLEQCLNHATENNLSIKQAHLNAELSKKSLIQSKFNLLPTINGSASQGYNFGRNIDPVTNQITIDRVKNNNFGLTSSITLFNGFQNLNNIKKSNFEYLASKYDAEKVANDILVNIVTAYLQLLYYEELVIVSQYQVNVSNIQVQRFSKMVEVGSLPKGDLLNAESQMTQEELQLVNYISQRDLALLNIKQLLDLKVTDPFQVVDPNLDPEEIYIPLNIEDVVLMASENLPQIKSATARVNSAKKSLSIAQGTRSPRFIMSGNFSTAFSDASKMYGGLDSLSSPIYLDYPFKDQLEDNVSKYVSFSLSIPLFNGWQTNTNISKAKINILQAQYNYQETSNQLRKTIEQAQNDALSAHKKYLASKKSMEAQQEAFQYIKDKFEVQLIDTYVFNDAKNKLFKTEADLLQSKYDYIFKTKILDFYMGNQLTF